MSGRYEGLLPGELSGRQRALYERIVGGPRRQQAGLVPVVDDEGRLLGPFGLMAIAPELGDAVQAVGVALRFAGGFAPRTRELAILTVAADRGSDFEWYAHASAGRAAGLTEEQLAAVQRSVEPEGLDPTDACVWRAARRILRDGGLDDDGYAEAVDLLGAPGLAELVWIIGYYSMLQTALSTFDPELPGSARGAATRLV